MSDSVMERFKAQAIESYRQALERGEHDGQCEWRPSGFYVCNCSKRAREARGFTEPPGALIFQMPICPGCYEEVQHDGDSYTCPRCCVDWDKSGVVASFYDDHGDLTADLAKWEAAHATQQQSADELPGGAS